MRGSANARLFAKDSIVRLDGVCRGSAPEGVPVRNYFVWSFQEIVHLQVAAQLESGLLRGGIRTGVGVRVGVYHSF